MRRVPFLTKQAKQKRQAFARQFLDWPAEKWSKVIFLDEMAVERFRGRRRRVWRSRGERDREDCSQPVVPHGGGVKLHVQGFFSSDGRFDSLEKYTPTLTSAKHAALLGATLALQLPRRPRVRKRYWLLQPHWGPAARVCTHSFPLH